jgi:hypothetical protein
MTVEELLNQITSLKHKQRVWASVADYLRLFLDQDLGESKAMIVDECIIPAVPKLAIEGVLEDEVYAKLEEIDESLKTLNAMTVATPTKRRPTQTKKKPARDSKKRTKKTARAAS